MLRRILIWCLSLVMGIVMLTGCSDSGYVPKVQAGTIGDEVVEANSKFAFDIFKALYMEKENENLFISPASISTVLAMTMNGASGKTLEQMEKVLGFKGIQKDEVNSGFTYLVAMLNRNNEGVDISLANSIWIREGFEVLESFKDVNKNYYSAAIEELDFNDSNAADTINRWVKDNTKGLIESIIDGNIDPATVMFLINTIYFKGEWAIQFDSNKTYEADFISDDSSVAKIDMMTKKGTTNYYDAGDYKIISLPYGEGGVVMDFVLPEKNTAMDSFISKFDMNDYYKAIESLVEREDVVIAVPKFKTEYEASLKKVLISLGMKEAFSEESNLTGINAAGNLFISDVKHKTFIEVNEEGTEAAGVTSVVIRLTGIMEPLEFIADRPFEYIIRDTKTGTIMFMGVFDTP